VLDSRFARFGALLRGEPETEEDRERITAVQKARDVLVRVQTETLAAARAEVLAARREPGVDPEAADRVPDRLDLRTVSLD
jgi:CPA1 family monovalent cation:H+ antiporter